MKRSVRFFDLMEEGKKKREKERRGGGNISGMTPQKTDQGLQA
jgi:hypothetical protein